jgi:hypothetical protein
VDEIRTARLVSREFGLRIEPARGYRRVRRGTAWDGSAYLEMQKEL